MQFATLLSGLKFLYAINIVVLTHLYYLYVLYAKNFHEINMKKVLKFSGIVYLLLFFAAISIFYLLYVPYQIGFKEQTGIFMFLSSYLEQYLQKPAILSGILGDFLTQFLALKVWAVAIPLLLLLLVWIGTVCLIKKAGGKSASYVSALLVVSVEVGLIVFLNYPLSSTVGLVISIWTANLLATISDRTFSRISFIVAIPLLYVLNGASVFTFMIAMIILNLKDWKFYIATSFAGFLIVALMGHFYNLTLLQSLIYPVMNGYVVPPAVFLALVPVAFLIAMICGKFNVYGWIMALPASAALFFSMYLSYDEKTEYAVELATHAYNDDWAQVKRMSLDNKLNHRLGIFYRNLSFAKEGKLAQELFKYPQMAADGLFMDLQPGVTFLEVFSYLDQLLEVGDVSQATDCALLCQTVMPKAYSSRGIKNLAEIALIVGDKDVANKYLDMLQATSLHKKWALKMKEYMAADSLPSEYIPYRNSMPLYDYTYQQNNWFESLSAMANANPYNVTAIDYLLSACLLNKNYQSFVSYYDRYYLNKLDRLIPVPEVYLQALLLQATDDESLQQLLEKYGIPMQMVEYYFAFVDAQAESQGDIRYLADFAGTYWYYMIIARFNAQ